MEISAMASSATPIPSLPTPFPHPVVTVFTKPQPRRNHIAFGLSFWGTSPETKEPRNPQRVAKVIRNILKPGIETALPIVRQDGEEVLKIASPTISEASKKAQSFSSWKTSQGREREDGCMAGEGVDLDFTESRTGERCTP
ncbi:hypothetical protein V8G54_036589 [Vigna mungo]|uniref:Uncharacterized protein n=1 Tax=Vigna mungo TaxID=3915 RepID=A0AAQ3RGR7_VIGMU